MKRKFFLSMTTVALIAGAFSASRFHQATVHPLSTLQIQNIDALSQTEETKKQTCYNTITTKNGSRVLYCQGCVWVEGTYTTFSGTDQCPK